MKTRTLGAHGFDVGEMGMGCWQLGGDWGSGMSEDQAAEILASAVEGGVTFLDTADVYGGGTSETRIGTFLRASDDSIRVATKFGRGGEVFPDAYSEEHLRRAVEGSLTRLGINHLDLLQLHCIPTAVLRDGQVFDWLRKLRQEGLISHFGASVETVEEGLICLEQEGLLSLQVIFNVFRQRLATELFPRAQAGGVGIIVRLPLASGLLSGKFSRDSHFPASDHRCFNRDGQCFNVGETFSGLPFARGVELVELLRAHLPEDFSMSQLAIRWILDHRAVSVVIPGASSPEQARQNAAMSDLPPLPRELHRALEELYAAQVHSQIRGRY